MRLRSEIIWGISLVGFGVVFFLLGIILGAQAYGGLGGWGLLVFGEFSMLSLPLLCAGGVLWHSGRKKERYGILDEKKKDMRISMSTEDMNKRFKRKLISGIIYFGIGIVLIIIGLLFQNILNKIYIFGFKFHYVLWVVGGILFIAGVSLFVHSVVLKNRMKKPEEIRKTEKEEKDELELERIVQ